MVTQTTLGQDQPCGARTEPIGRRQTRPLLYSLAFFSTVGVVSMNDLPGPSGQEVCTGVGSVELGLISIAL